MDFGITMLIVLTPFVVLPISIWLFHWWGILIGIIASIIISIFIGLYSDNRDIKRESRGISEQEKKNLANSPPQDFASQVRQQTATESDLKRRKEDSVRRQIQSNVDDVLGNVKTDAMKAAQDNGKRYLRQKYRIYTYEGRTTSFGERKIAEETAQELTSRLTGEGFQSVMVNCSKDSSWGYYVNVLIEW